LEPILKNQFNLSVFQQCRSKDLWKSKSDK